MDRQRIDKMEHEDSYKVGFWAGICVMAIPIFWIIMAILAMAGVIK